MVGSLQGNEVRPHHPCHLAASLALISDFCSHFAAAELRRCWKDLSMRIAGFQVGDHHAPHGQDSCADSAAREVLAEGSIWPSMQDIGIGDQTAVGCFAEVFQPW